MICASDTEESTSGLYFLLSVLQETGQGQVFKKTDTHPIPVPLGNKAVFIRNLRGVLGNKCWETLEHLIINKNQ